MTGAFAFASSSALARGQATVWFRTQFPAFGSEATL